LAGAEPAWGWGAGAPLPHVVHWSPLQASLSSEIFDIVKRRKKEKRGRRREREKRKRRKKMRPFV